MNVPRGLLVFIAIWGEGGLFGGCFSGCLGCCFVVGVFWVILFGGLFWFFLEGEVKSIGKARKRFQKIKYLEYCYKTIERFARVL